MKKALISLVVVAVLVAVPVFAQENSNASQSVSEEKPYVKSTLTSTPGARQNARRPIFGEKGRESEFNLFFGKGSTNIADGLSAKSMDIGGNFEFYIPIEHKFWRERLSGGFTILYSRSAEFNFMGENFRVSRTFAGANFNFYLLRRRIRPFVFADQGYITNSVTSTYGGSQSDNYGFVFGGGVKVDIRKHYIAGGRCGYMLGGGLKTPGCQGIFGLRF